MCFQLQGDVEILEHKSLNEAYSSVGGLNKQIETIRDLLEIPLSRPELFRYFGMWFSRFTRFIPY